MTIVSSYTLPIAPLKVASETPHRRAKILQLAEEHPDARMISIAERGDGGRLFPRPRKVIYVMSYSCGGWSRAHQILVGAGLENGGVAA